MDLLKGVFNLLFVCVISLYNSGIAFSQCPNSVTQANNGQGQSGCNTSDSPPSGSWTVSGAWTFATGPASDLTISSVYKGSDLWQLGNVLQPISGTTGNLWFGGYNQSTNKMCFYSQAANINTPASGNWKIIFQYPSGTRECTYNTTGGNGATVTLPVTWEAVSAQKQNSQVLINWSTASEQNTKDFEVQYSTNTNNWDPIGTVQAAGNSTTTKNYSFTHQSPLKNNTYNYYRILQRDIDGKFSYSKIVSIVFDEQGPDFLVYPNPADKLATIYLSEASEVSLVNSAGSVVWKSKLPSGRNLLPLEKYSAGVYIFRAGKSSQRLVIQ